MNQFITSNELSRELQIPVSRITSAVEAGVITPAGRAGNHRHSPIVFLRSEIESIKNTLTTAGRMKAMASVRPSHQCRNTADVLQKFDALRRAKEESK